MKTTVRSIGVQLPHDSQAAARAGTCGGVGDECYIVK